MVRGATQFAVALLLLVAGAGLPALAAVDGPDGATGGTTASIAPLNETDDTTNSTDETNTTDDTTNSTDETLTNTTDETNTTNTTDDTTNTSDDTTNTTDDTTNTSDETLTNTTNTTEGTTDETEDATNTTNTTDDTTNATDGATNTTDSVTGETDETANTTDEVTHTVADVTNQSAVTPLSDASLRLSSTTLTGTSLSSSSSLLDDPLDSDASDSSRPSESSGSSAKSSGEQTDGNATGTTTDERRTTTTASSASTEDRTGGRDGIVPEGASEAMVGMGALTAAALVPQLADVLTLVGNAGGLLSASMAFAGSTSKGRHGRVGGLRSRIDRLWRFVTPFRYSRWDDSDPLDHEIREALYETVERAPGAYLSEVCDRADVAVSTARHHLDVLEDEGLVTTAKVRGKRRYYPDHAPDVELTAALEDEGTAEVLHALARLGASHGGRLADELDRDASTVSHHLSRLEDAGLVEREREGRAVVNRLTSEVQAVLRGDGEADGDTDAETPAVAD